METQRPALLRLSTVRSMKRERAGDRDCRAVWTPRTIPFSLGVRETSPSREPPRLLQKGSILLVHWIYFGRRAEVARCTFEGKLSEPHHHRAMLCRQREGNTRACSHTHKPPCKRSPSAVGHPCMTYTISTFHSCDLNRAWKPEADIRRLLPPPPFSRHDLSLNLELTVSGLT